MPALFIGGGMDMSGNPRRDIDRCGGAHMLGLALKDERECVAEMSPDALNRRPAGDDTTSIAVLVTHSLHSTRSWLSVALGVELSARDRPPELRASAEDGVALLRVIDDLGADCETLPARRQLLTGARYGGRMPGLAPPPRRRHRRRGRCCTHSNTCANTLDRCS